LRSIRSTILPILLCLCFGCREEILSDFRGERVVAVTGMLTDLDTTHWVRVAWSVTNLSEKDGNGNPLSEPVDSAIVTLYEDGREIQHFMQDSLPGYYALRHFKATPGKYYELKVEIPGVETCYAGDTLEAAPAISGVNTRYLYEIASGNQTVAVFNPLLHFEDPVGRDYYMIPAEEPGQTDYVISDAGFNGQYLRVESPRPIISYGTGNSEQRKVSLYRISETSYQFLDAVSKQNDADGGIFKPLPVVPVGNIRAEKLSKAVGVFIVAGVSTKMFYF
jgi:hypothetical protein